MNERPTFDEKAWPVLPEIPNGMAVRVRRDQALKAAVDAEDQVEAAEKAFEAAHRRDREHELEAASLSSEKWTGKDGNKQERTEWHRVEVFGKTAQVVRDYCQKGKQIYLEGRLETRAWEKDGQKHNTTEVKADKIVLLGGGRGGGERSADRGGQGDEYGQMREPAAPAAITDDDIPF